MVRNSGSADMWDDRFIFVLSALFGISLWIVISKRRAAIRTARPPWLAYGSLNISCCGDRADFSDPLF